MSDDEMEYFKPGELFRGYRVERLLGRGGIGAVYLVKHEVLDTFYALKILYPSVATKDPVYIKRFLREARLATRIRHPNLVSVHDCGSDVEKGLYYLVMDYVSGDSLRSALAFEGAFPIERAADVVIQVASALKAAQQFNVVHRDIKPENIMIQTDGLIKLVDLGIAKAKNLGDSVMTKTDSMFGTPSYISPEQAINSAKVDLRADIYSLGIVFFEMLTGVSPYRGTNVSDILSRILSNEETPDIRDFKPGLPDDLAIFVRRMTVKDINRRMSSFEEVINGLVKLGYGRKDCPRDTVEFAAKPEVGMKTLLGKCDLASDDDRNTVRSSEKRSIFSWIKSRMTAR